MRVRKYVKELLEQIGEDPRREGLRKTPQRVEDVLSFLTDGYQQDLSAIVNGAVFKEKVDDMVIVKDVNFFSLCEHHLLPFYGTCHIGYLPTGKILGLSKFPRIVEMYSRRLQLQERLTNQIANAIQEILNPLGVAVVMEAAHLCMMMRGVEKQGSTTVTSAMLGDFREDDKTRNEFLRLIEK
ncbi:MAG: GTP cyclohydrolase I FolE [Gemmatimonadota bacterium]|nr:MAG: GTP cyclohydrolase I FolE [Gemmatimonadota bacterium]